MDSNESRVRQTEAFSLFDKSGSGKISSKDVASVMRTLGRNPTEREIQGLLSKIDPNNEGSVDLETFLKHLADHLPFEEPTEELLEAFQVFDKKNLGYISIHEMRHILTNYGEKLSEPEIDEFLAVADEMKTGYVKYVEFVKVMTLH
uniref:Calmodulin n=2 Tax=Cacopsylla melanoneura TaxID=428564 RepID=A0A8D8TV76_9HEMI